MRRLRSATPMLLGVRGLAVAVSALLALAACGGSGGGTTDNGKVTIEFAQAGLGTEQEATQAAIKEFEAANPNITVKMVVLSTDATQ